MAAQRVHGLWSVVHGLEKTINCQLLTRIKSKSTISFQPHSGFSLIELMVVIVLFAITTIAVTTSYISFQGREIVKSAALQLKSDLRQAQNSAQIGDKVSNDNSSGAGCASYDVSTKTVSSYSLGGWYLSITNGGTSYTINGVCLNTATYAETIFGTDYANFPNGVTISSITCGPTGGSLTTLGATDSLNVLFRPLSNNVSFFQNSNNFYDNTTGVLNVGCFTGNGEAVITVHSSDGDFEVHINQAGEINEKKI